MSDSTLFADESICTRLSTKKILVPLTQGERNDATDELTDAVERMRTIETKKKNADSIWAEEIKQERLIINERSQKIRKGMLKDVDIKEFFYWKTGKVVMVRCDTGEILGERRITEDDQPMTTDGCMKPEEVPILYLPNNFKEEMEVKPEVLAIEDKTEEAEFEVVTSAVHEAEVEEQNKETETGAE